MKRGDEEIKTILEAALKARREYSRLYRLKNREKMNKTNREYAQKRRANPKATHFTVTGYVYANGQVKWQTIYFRRRQKEIIFFDPKKLKK